jgi:hypothetical protein
VECGGVEAGVDLILGSFGGGRAAASTRAEAPTRAARSGSESSLASRAALQGQGPWCCAHQQEHASLANQHLGAGDPEILLREVRGAQRRLLTKMA